MSTAAEKLYDEDFFAWTQLQARELQRFARTRPNLPLDLKHIAEEVADIGKEQRNALRSWSTRIIEHLLQLEHSSAEGPRRGWADEVVTFRAEFADRLTPTLRRDLERRLPRLYQRACANLSRKLDIHGEAEETAARLPESCPYILDQVLGDYWPSRRDDARG